MEPEGLEEAKPAELPFLHHCPDIVPDEIDKEDEVEQAAPSSSIPLEGIWVISTTRGTSCLHVVGCCHRVPGIQYQGWTTVDKTVEEGKHKKVCKTCFPHGPP